MPFTRKINSAPEDEGELCNRIKELQFTLFEITQLLSTKCHPKFRVKFLNLFITNFIGIWQEDKSKPKTESTGDRKHENLEEEKISEVTSLT